MKCRHCKSPLKHKFVDLGFAPHSNAYLNINQLDQPEKYYPLKVFICDQCWLAQTADISNSEDLFREDYAYFSSTSKSWLKHAENYSEQITKRLKLNKNSFVVEIASNDGYLLKNFNAREIPCMGIEPTRSTAEAAKKLGINTLIEFFGATTASLINSKADLIIGNNVYAHVPDINDFTQGLKILLAPQGTITLEFPHLYQLFKNNQFDTIYHEHFSYLSLHAVSKIINQHQLKIYDVDELETHGGSLRIYLTHQNHSLKTSSNVSKILQKEVELGLTSLEIYKKFQEKAEAIKNNFVSFLIAQKKLGKSIHAYGAAAKGNTLLNFSGIKHDLISCVYDAAPAKQGKYLPGSHIPILDPKNLPLSPPDYLVIFPWNIKNEIHDLYKNKLKDKTSFVTFIPETLIFS